MAGYLFIDEPVPGSWNRQHRRLTFCCAISAVVLYLAMANLDLPIRLDIVRWIPEVLEVRLRRKPEPEPEPEAEERASQHSEARPMPEPVTPTATSEQSEPAPTPATTDAAVSQPARTETPIDWYESLERTAADVVNRDEGPQSMHPAFDEQRRIAAVRYAKPRTGKPPPIWEQVEKDVYGRTILRRGNCYTILDDPSVINRYAFETFEQFLTFCSGSSGKPKNLPWVEIIRARYNYLRGPVDVPVASKGR